MWRESGLSWHLTVRTFHLYTLHPLNLYINKETRPTQATTGNTRLPTIPYDMRSANGTGIHAPHPLRIRMIESSASVARCFAVHMPLNNLKCVREPAHADFSHTRSQLCKCGALIFASCLFALLLAPCICACCVHISATCVRPRPRPRARFRQRQREQHGHYHWRAGGLDCRRGHRMCSILRRGKSYMLQIICFSCFPSLQLLTCQLLYH